MEQNLKLIEEEIKETLKKNKAYVQTILSMPGIDMITSLAIMSYMVIANDSLRLNKPLTRRSVPRIDISGNSTYYGRIVSRGCHSIRRVIVQVAWSLVRCQYGGRIKEFYKRLLLHIERVENKQNKMS
ncbi:transposase, IS116/IS110/IS902 family [Leptospira borgpetersenii serovar Pomona str. 200901868]|uniref:Transposase, IS116/IS110/IS902 family n=1 Tax=Leptospira borgpetersenii serovar Pomona str. 200901868 TaxID=1192866 RepID=M6VZ05_LEPBO|nr:transposase, IS116/IS110/IS902 family [Leptospira borgpetersenii serovar Pomona str. 200901868]